MLGCGDPRTAKYAVILEAPGRDETVFELRPNPKRAFLATKEECERELEIRKRDYQLDDSWLRAGVPVVGQTGLALQFWIWPKVGIRREECFIDNTIRCLPQKSRSGIQYPTGETKHAAEKHCRQYDRIAEFRPDTVVFSLHPAGLLREITPLPLVIKDFEKVRDFTQQGRRVLALLGGKSTGAFARYGTNVTKWRGHYAALAEGWVESYKRLFEYKAKRREKEVIERPKELNSVACKSWKRYKGKSAPKCGCEPCWVKYEEVHRVTDR